MQVEPHRAADEIALGAAQLLKGFGKWTNVVLGIAAATFVLSFLAWAASGGSFSFTGMLQDTVTRSVPIILGAIAGSVGATISY